MSQDVEVLDPEDTSWIDQSMMIEADDAIRVKVVEHRRSKSTARHPNNGQMDFDGEVRPFSQGFHMNSRQFFSGPSDRQRTSKNANRWCFGPKIRAAKARVQDDQATAPLLPAIRKSRLEVVQ